VCSGSQADKATEFFTPKAESVEGAVRPLAEGLESANLCRTLHEKDSQPVDQFFKVGGAPAPLAKAAMVSTPSAPMVAKPAKK
jgi:hypothetical protein